MKKIFRLMSIFLIVSLVLGGFTISAAGAGKKANLIVTRTGEKIVVAFEKELRRNDDPVRVMLIDNKGYIWVHHYDNKNKKEIEYKILNFSNYYKDYGDWYLDFNKEDRIARVDIGELNKYIKLADNINKFSAYGDYRISEDGWFSETDGTYYYNAIERIILLSNHYPYYVVSYDDNSLKIRDWVDDIEEQIIDGKTGLLSANVDYYRTNIYGNRFSNLQNGGYFTSQLGTMYYTNKFDTSLEEGIYKRNTDGSVIKLCSDDARQLNVCGDTLYYIYGKSIYSINTNGKNRKRIFKLSDCDVYAGKESTLGETMIVKRGIINFTIKNCYYKMSTYSSKDKDTGEGFYDYYIRAYPDNYLEWERLSDEGKSKPLSNIIHKYVNTSTSVVTVDNELYFHSDNYGDDYKIKNLVWCDNFIPLYLTENQLTGSGYFDNSFINTFYFIDEKGILSHISYFEDEDWSDELYYINNDDYEDYEDEGNDDSLKKHTELAKTKIKCSLAKAYKNKIIYIEKGEKSRLYCAYLDIDGVFKNKLIVNKSVSDFYIGETYISYIDTVSGELMKKTFKF